MESLNSVDKVIVNGGSGICCCGDTENQMYIEDNVFNKYQCNVRCGRENSPYRYYSYAESDDVEDCNHRVIAASKQETIKWRYDNMHGFEQVFLKDKI